MLRRPAAETGASESASTRPSWLYEWTLIQRIADRLVRDCPIVDRERFVEMASDELHVDRAVVTGPDPRD
jgi:hypothetical protein